MMRRAWRNGGVVVRRGALCLAIGIVAGAAAAHRQLPDPGAPQEAGAAQQAPDDDDDDIVIEGRRDSRRLQGGLWTVNLSKSYHYGAPLADHNEQRPAGSEKTWRFCLSDTEVEPMIRLLVGEGHGTASGTATCSRLNATIADGKIAGEQRCSGLTMQRPAAPTVMGMSGPAPAVDSCSGGGGTALVPARGTLSVSGGYAPTRLKLEFYDAREPVCFDPRYGSRPYGRHWTIDGARTGDCDAGGAAAK